MNELQMQSTLPDLHKNLLSTNEIIEETIAALNAIKGQIAEAKSNAAKTGDYSDHQWFQKASSALRYRKAEHQSLLREAASLRREIKRLEHIENEKRSMSLERKFMWQAKKVMDDATYQRILSIAMIAEREKATSFQGRVKPWMMTCFGSEISADSIERNHRFLEEALELVQACGCTQSEAHQLVDYVFGRPIGEKHQEVGGVMVTLAALCLAQSLNMHECGEVELARIWTKVEKIRAKQAAKPKHSPLPQSAQPEQEPVGEVQHWAAPANVPAYVNVKWYGKPPKNGTKLYTKPATQGE